uniref:Uncharacterized protein n=1 Tax=Glossina austeni TaxID=7395 RepID=A0A1A9V1F8_GLOAU
MVGLAIRSPPFCWRRPPLDWRWPLRPRELSKVYISCILDQVSWKLLLQKVYGSHTEDLRFVIS